MKVWIALGVIGFLWLNTALANVPNIISVRLFEPDSVSRVSFQGPFRIVSPQPYYIRPQQVIRLQLRHGHLRWVCSAQTVNPACGQSARRWTLQAIHSEGVKLNYKIWRHYPGQLQMTVGPNETIQLVNTMPTRTYVAAVVASETLPNWPLEMLKAQAVIVQTRLRLPNALEGLGDSTQRQRYAGMDGVTPRVNEAVGSVWGQWLRFGKKPSEALFHAACGGHTSNEGVFTGRRLRANAQHFQPVSCPYCAKSPFSKPHHIQLTWYQLASFLQKPRMFVSLWDPYNRPLQIKLADGQFITGYAFWLRLGQTLGWDKVPGLKYSLTTTPKGLQVVSIGAGHGVGLCQWGAAELARRGKTYQQILNYYYPRTSLVTH